MSDIRFCQRSSTEEVLLESPFNDYIPPHRRKEFWIKDHFQAMKAIWKGLKSSNVTFIFTYVYNL